MNDRPLTLLMVTVISLVALYLARRSEGFTKPKTIESGPSAGGQFIEPPTVYYHPPQPKLSNTPP